MDCLSAAFRKLWNVGDRTFFLGAYNTGEFAVMSCAVGSESAVARPLQGPSAAAAASAAAVAAEAPRKRLRMIRCG